MHNEHIVYAKNKYKKLKNNTQSKYKLKNTKYYFLKTYKK
jgi:hypothetical protein